MRHNNYYVRNGREKIFEINCKTNVEKFNYPDVEFYLVGDNQNVKITNLTLNETMEFKDLPKGSHHLIRDRSSRIKADVGPIRIPFDDPKNQITIAVRFRETRHYQITNAAHD